MRVVWQSKCYSSHPSSFEYSFGEYILQSNVICSSEGSNSGGKSVKGKGLAFVQSDISEYSISIGGNFVGKLPNRLIGFPGAEKVNKLKDNHDFSNGQHDYKDDEKQNGIKQSNTDLFSGNNRYFFFFCLFLRFLGCRLCIFTVR